MLLKVATYILVFLINTMAVTAYAEDSPPKSTKLEDKQAVAGSLAKVFLNKMNKAQSVLSNTPSKYHVLILAGLAGALNHRLADVLEYEAKKIGVSATDPRFYGIMGHSITKLAVLAHHLNSDDAGACHFKEARYLLAAADGGERVLANCRQPIYGDVEIEGIKFLTSPQSKELEPAYEEWLINNIEYSIAVSCLAGFCL